MNSSGFATSSGKGFQFGMLCLTWNLGHVRQAGRHNRQNRTLSHCNFNWGFNPSISLHASSSWTATVSPHLPGLGSYFPRHAFRNMKFWPWQKLLTILEHIGQASGCGQPLLPQLLQTLVRLGSSKHIVPELVQKTHVVWQQRKLKISRGRRYGTQTLKLKCDQTQVKHTSLRTPLTLSLRILQQSSQPKTPLLPKLQQICQNPSSTHSHSPQSIHSSWHALRDLTKTPTPGLRYTTTPPKFDQNST